MRIGYPKKGEGPVALTPFPLGSGFRSLQRLFLRCPRFTPGGSLSALAESYLTTFLEAQGSVG